MKKILVLLLVLTMICTTVLVGCTKQETPAASSETNAGTNSESNEPSKPESKYPEKTITIIAPYAAGGAVDILSRTLADYLTKTLDQPVIVVNKPGGGGSVGTAEAARAEADGYTLVVVSNGGLIVNPYATEVGYTYESLTPISLLTEVPIGIGVKADSPFNTIEDLIEYAKENPNKIKYATPGANSTPHLAMEKLAQLEGIQWNHMPNGSSPQAMAELLGGHIDVFTVNLPTFQPNYDAKTIKILGITGNERTEAMPDVPTLKEQGYDIPLSVWFGILGPKGLSEDVNAILNEHIKNACSDPAVTGEWEKIQMPATYLNSEEFSEKIKADDESFNPVLKGMGIIK